MIKVCVFDLDGTLTHSHPGIYGCFRYALEKMGLPEPKLEQLRRCIGPSLMYSFQNYFDMDEETAKVATAILTIQITKITKFYRRVCLRATRKSLSATTYRQCGEWGFAHL